jgi:hypothetical protein
MLEDGDMIETRDGGLQPLRWSGCTTVVTAGDLAPIVITAGTFGNTADLVVSPQHAVLIQVGVLNCFMVKLRFCCARLTCLVTTAFIVAPGGVVNYWHILFDANQVVHASGIWSESLYPGETTMDAISPKAQNEIRGLLDDITTYRQKAAPCIRKFEATVMSAAYA